jgi:dTDP-4-amino-4,6-dideoxygalactose transaminase
MKYEIPFIKKNIQITNKNIFKYIDQEKNDDDSYNKACQNYLEKLTGSLCLLTPSCTASLEMAALICEIKKGDEVILPSYTFVSTATAFLLRGAKLVFVDIDPRNLIIDTKKIEQKITKKTKIIIVVHYAGYCDNMMKIKKIAEKNNIYMIEDAAQSIFSKDEKNRHAGTIGDIGCISFHYTKNISCGEGGAILINNKKLYERALLIRDKGTNRTKFLNGEVDKYTWIDIGSSYKLSEIQAATLLDQFKIGKKITKEKQKICKTYYENLKKNIDRKLIYSPKFFFNKRSNGHFFYFICKNKKDRIDIINKLKSEKIQASFHYVPLHNSPAASKFKIKYEKLEITESYSELIIRLPVYVGMSLNEIKNITNVINEYLEKNLVFKKT